MPDRRLDHQAKQAITRPAHPLLTRPALPIPQHDGQPAPARPGQPIPPRPGQPIPPYPGPPIPPRPRQPIPPRSGLPVSVRRARLIALATGTFLLPWCVLLGLTLPATAEAQHWSLAWAGLDGAEAMAALSTAVLLRRADPHAGLTAVAGGTLLLVDAWFDVCTSAPGLAHALAVAEACCLELPLAGAAFWLALHLTHGAQQHAPASNGLVGPGP